MGEVAQEEREVKERLSSREGEGRRDARRGARGERRGERPAGQTSGARGRRTSEGGLSGGEREPVWLVLCRREERRWALCGFAFVGRRRPSLSSFCLRVGGPIPGRSILSKPHTSQQRPQISIEKRQDDHCRITSPLICISNAEQPAAARTEPSSDLGPQLRLTRDRPVGAPGETAGGEERRSMPRHRWPRQPEWCWSLISASTLQYYRSTSEQNSGKVSDLCYDRTPSIMQAESSCKALSVVRSRPAVFVWGSKGH